jgi:hypothetical protein
MFRWSLALLIVAAQDATNLVEDPGFEQAKPGAELPRPWTQWKSDRSTYAPSIASGGHGGTQCLQVTGEGGETAINGKTIDVSPGERYLLSGWTRAEGDKTARATIQLVYWSKEGKWLGNSTFGETFGDSAEWRRLASVSQLEKFPDARSLSIALTFSGKGTAQFDDLVLSKVSAPAPGNLIVNGDLEVWSEEMLVSWFVGSPKESPIQARRVVENPKVGASCVGLSGKSPWANITSAQVAPDKAKELRASAHVKVRKGQAHVQIGYFGQGKWLGSSDSAPSSSGDWTELSVDVDAAKLKAATHVTVAVIAGGEELDVLIDDVRLVEKPAK